MVPRTRLFSCALGLVAALAFAGPAQAQVSGEESLNCTVEGSATAAVRWLATGPSSFNFGPSGLGISCVYADRKGLNVSTGVAHVVGGSVGGFAGTFCGTGSAADGNPGVTSVTTTPNNPKVETQILVANWAYNIAFDSFEGTLTWEDPIVPWGSPQPNPRKTPTKSVPVGGGEINISPWTSSQGGIFPGDFPEGYCSNGFNVEGAVTATFAD